MAQKSLLLLTLMVVATISGCASSPTRTEVVRATMGQKMEPTPIVTYTPVGCSGGPKYYETSKDCEIAMQSGECSYYTPRYIGERGKNPVDNNKLFLVQMEEPVCVKTPTVKGVYWVAQPPGTEFRFGKEKDGSFSKIPYALHACGNRVLGIVYPQPNKKVVSYPPAPPPPAQARNVCAEKGYFGDEYFTGIDPKTGRLDCLYVEEVSFWDTKTGTVIKVVGVVVVVGAVVLYCSKHDCKFWKHDKPAPSNPPPPPPKGPINPWGIGGPQ